MNHHQTQNRKWSETENTDKNIFYTTLWGCVYSSASIRLPAVTFIMTQLNKKRAGNQKYILGNDIPLLVSILQCQSSRFFGNLFSHQS